MDKEPASFLWYRTNIRQDCQGHLTLEENPDSVHLTPKKKPCETSEEQKSLGRMFVLEDTIPDPEGGVIYYGHCQKCGSKLCAHQSDRTENS